MQQPHYPQVKRKPPPAIDPRYPAPDPNDPFAPLWFLRSREVFVAAPDEAALLRHAPSHDIFLPALANRPKENHYRRRSQSTPATQVTTNIAFPSTRQQHDGTVSSDHTSDSSDVDVSVNVLSSCPSPPKRLVHKLLPKRSHQNPAVSATDPQPRLRTSTISPGKPALSSPFVHISSPTRPGPDDAFAYTNPRPAPCPVATSPIPASVSVPLLKRRVHIHRPHRSLPHPVPPPVEPEWAHPTRSQLARAAALPLIAASGLRVSFAALFATRRTIVIFIRHFWCPLCQDYLTTVAAANNQLQHLAVAETGEKVDLVIISNGAHAFIPKYRQLFGLKCEMYTDPDLRVYHALGMGRTAATSPRSSSADHAEACLAPDSTCSINNVNIGPDPQGITDGGYVRHTLVGGIAMVVARALKNGMPVWEKGGDIQQLGGEFVLGPGLTCTYAHRMQSPKGHAPIRDVFDAAGVHLPAPAPPLSTLPSSRTLPNLNIHIPTLPELARRTWHPRTNHNHSSSGGTPVRKRRNAQTSNNIGTTSSSSHKTLPDLREFGAWREGTRGAGTGAGVLGVSERRRPSTSSGVTRGHRRNSSGLALSPEEEAVWMRRRSASLRRLQERKSERRGAFVGYFGKEKERQWSGTVSGDGTDGASQCAPVCEEEPEPVMVIGFEGRDASISDVEEDDEGGAVEKAVEDDLAIDRGRNLEPEEKEDEREAEKPGSEMELPGESAEPPLESELESDVDAEADVGLELPAQNLDLNHRHLDVGEEVEGRVQRSSSLRVRAHDMDH
ncbi:hypothetical protein H0H81_009007 [Sphagnurus paluster]|uniref:Uncharacterized protein n=1 Tax=Sphagnurus paluster TaxID=117069 RepID=A0A9P7KIW2_9AGAR|nr:hypothetical protein H0H81_009007 [Sphagnurus paluster]